MCYSYVADTHATCFDQLLVHLDLAAVLHHLVAADRNHSLT